ncbi:hypothetical protein [Streptomyces sp. W4I9-2]|uniref:hypothetical protein n=1 Tax=Streptomyces sp. W4I9-2 TaxID=3042297 RepID=UPI002784271C|nr:hypothetical protein [Streptomyces sp. W4I9-2]MDQ0694210.1 hypothetical protein [Streptomyces sp. W4I9-2]
MARYEINHLDGNTDTVTNAPGHEWSGDVFLVLDANKQTIYIAPTANIRSVLVHDEAVTD